MKENNESNSTIKKFSFDFFIKKKILKIYTFDETSFKNFELFVNFWIRKRINLNLKLGNEKNTFQILKRNLLDFYKKK